MFWFVVILIVGVGITLFVMQQNGMLSGSKQRPELPSLKRNLTYKLVILFSTWV